MSHPGSSRPTAATGVLLMLLSLPLAAAGPDYGTVVPAGAGDGDLTLHSCEVLLPGDDRSYAGDCGTLVVPENRRRPGSRLIALPVTRVRATGSAPLEPIFWFQGGPGNPNSMDYPTDGLLRRHDLVMVGYRGVDGQVALLCPEIGAALGAVAGPLLGTAALASYAEAGAACARRLAAEGVDLDGYSMIATVEDMEAARRALGYQRINLFGNSYGTRVQMLYQWRHPGSLQRVVMVSVNPPGHFVWDPRVVERQLGQYAALCAQDAYCRGRTPDLLATLRQVAADMPRHWLGIPIDADAVRLLSFFFLMESIPVPGWPLPASGPVAIDLWLDAAEGDASGMALVSLFGRMMMRFLGERGHALAMGMSAPDLAQPALDTPAELMPPGAILGSPMSAYLAGIAPGWPASSDQAEATVPDSAIETLLVSGTIDFSTPLEAAREELLPHLSRGHQVVLREFGHTETIWNSQPEARARLLNAFFDSGVVDASLYRDQAPRFDVERSLGGIARALAAAAALLAVALVVLVVLAVRWLRRRARQPA